MFGWVTLTLTLLAILATEHASATQPKPAIPTAKDTGVSGRFVIQDGTENATWLATRFRESLWQNDNHLRQLNQQSLRSLDEYLSGTEYSTAKKMLTIVGQWQTGSKSHTWVFYKPEQEGGMIDRALELEDLSGPDGYHVQVTAHCYDEPDFCKSFREKQNELLAPKPAPATGDLALGQWHHRVQTEQCKVHALNMQQPRYPTIALREGVQGSVMVGILFNTCGNVRDSWIHQTSGSHELDRAAQVQALKWQIDIQSLKKTTMIPGQAVVPVSFLLGD